MRGVKKRNPRANITRWRDGKGMVPPVPTADPTLTATTSAQNSPNALYLSRQSLSSLAASQSNSTQITCGLLSSPALPLFVVAKV